MEKKDTINVKDYGDMICQINDLELVDYQTDGGYQGDYLVIGKDVENKRLFYYVGSYGSCSWCDWLEAENLGDYSSEDGYIVKYKDALEFCGGIKPKFIVPEKAPLKIEFGKYEGFTIDGIKVDSY